MTENERKAIEKIRELQAFNNGLFNLEHHYAMNIAVKAIEENQQYHAIGTVEELQALKEKAVLIMDMPASCGKCQLKLVGEYLDVRCAIGHRIIPIAYGRPEWCPLKQISTGEDKNI